MDNRVRRFDRFFVRMRWTMLATAAFCVCAAVASFWIRVWIALPLGAGGSVLETRVVRNQLAVSYFEPEAYYLPWNGAFVSLKWTESSATQWIGRWDVGSPQPGWHELAVPLWGIALPPCLLTALGFRAHHRSSLVGRCPSCHYQTKGMKICSECGCKQSVEREI